MGTKRSWHLLGLRHNILVLPFFVLRDDVAATRVWRILIARQNFTIAVACFLHVSFPQPNFRYSQLRVLGMMTSLSSVQIKRASQEVFRFFAFPIRSVDCRHGIEEISLLDGDFVRTLGHRPHGGLGLREIAWTCVRPH